MAFSLFLIRGGDRIYQIFSRRGRWVTYVIAACISALLILYVLDVVTLIRHLALLRASA